MFMQTGLQNRQRFHRHNLITLGLCLIGVTVNLLLGYAAGWLNLPLYLDTVGTVSASVMGGYLPGMLVGFITNILKSISDPSSLYYGVLNVMIALAAAVMAKFGWFRKPVKIVFAVCIFALIGGGIGSLIPWFLDGVSFDSESFAAALHGTGMFSAEAAHMLSGILMDLLDKAVSVLLVLVIIRLLPKRVRSFCEFSGWMQTPLTEEESSAAKKVRFRVMSLRTKILLVLSISLIAVSVSATVIVLRLYRNALIKDRTRVAEGAANIAASAIDAERIDEFLTAGESVPGYDKTERLLYEIRDSSPDIMYLYVYRIEPDGCHVVFDLDTDETAGSEPGEIQEFDPSFAPYIDDLLAGKEIEPIISDDAYGWLLTVYKPVYNAAGKCVCYAAADDSNYLILVIQRNFF